MTDHDFDRPEPRKFTGHERDFIGGTESNASIYLDYMHARYYNSNVGRFLSVDPDMNLNFAGAEPQARNRYAHVRNNPINKFGAHQGSQRPICTTATRYDGRGTTVDCR